MKAEGRMQPGGASPEAFFAALCLQNTSLALISLWFWLARAGYLGISEEASQMRRLFGPMGGSGRQDISMARDTGGEVSPLPVGGDNFVAWAARRKSQKKPRTGD